MDEYFDRYEYQPNLAQIHIDAIPKKEIWEEYKRTPRRAPSNKFCFCFVSYS